MFRDHVIINVNFYFIRQLVTNLMFVCGVCVCVFFYACVCVCVFSYFALSYVAVYWTQARICFVVQNGSTRCV
jgi:hypothetical protein